MLLKVRRGGRGDEPQPIGVGVSIDHPLIGVLQQGVVDGLQDLRQVVLLVQCDPAARKSQV